MAADADESFQSTLGLRSGTNEAYRCGAIVASRAVGLALGLSPYIRAAISAVSISNGMT